MSPRFERIAILGLGLLGGSLGLAARERGLARCVVGASRSRETLAAARERGAVDEGFRDGAQAVRGAELVVLATPPFAMPAVLREVAPALQPEALVTDVGSVKAPVASVLPGLLPPGVCYLGSHPMAGSHRRGIAHARADLFDGAACVVTPTAGCDAALVEQLCAFWSALGARVVLRDPDRHDLEVAWVSHLPHALAFAFARALADAPSGCGAIVGAGFRDFTRIAQADPELWAEILTANRKALAGPLQAAAAQMRELSERLEAGDLEAVERFLGEARSALATASAPDGPPRQARSGGREPEIRAARSGRERSKKHRT